jgi:hypothetical protein
MKKQDLINLINNNEELDYLSAVEDIIPKEVNCVAEHLYVDKHRWFSTSVNVYACEDGYVGIRGVDQLFSPYMCFSDCDYPCEASEYEEVVTITYKRVKV